MLNSDVYEHTNMHEFYIHFANVCVKVKKSSVTKLAKLMQRDDKQSIARHFGVSI